MVTPLAGRSLNWLLRTVTKPGRLPNSVFTRGERGDEAVVQPPCLPDVAWGNKYHVYEAALRLQRALVTVVADSADVDGVVLLLEHPPVYTLGKRGGRGNLTVTEGFLKKKGIPIIPIERGGDITYHGPGQLVGYPVVSLKRPGIKVVDYVHLLEEAMLRTTGAFHIKANRDARNRGICV